MWSEKKTELRLVQEEGMNIYDVRTDFGATRRGKACTGRRFGRRQNHAWVLRSVNRAQRHLHRFYCCFFRVIKSCSSAFKRGVAWNLAFGEKPQSQSPHQRLQQCQQRQQLQRVIPTPHVRQFGQYFSCYCVSTSPTRRQTPTDPQKARRRDLRRLQGSCRSDKTLHNKFLSSTISQEAEKCWVDEPRRPLTNSTDTDDLGHLPTPRHRH